MAQRLVRKICEHCAETYVPRGEELHIFERNGVQVTELKRGRGCNECAHTGYKGRVGIHEVLTMDETLNALIMDKRTDLEYEAHAISAGMVPILKDGLMKVAVQWTTVEEVMRVIH